jgi:hypothetical protein
MFPFVARVVNESLSQVVIGYYCLAHMDDISCHL